MTKLLRFLLVYLSLASVALAQSVPPSLTLGGHANSVAPDHSNGAEGNWFFDVDSGEVWGPKTSGAWPASPAYTPSGGGGSLRITDGTHTVAGTTSLTVTGATVGGTTPNATLAVAGSGSLLSATVTLSSAQILNLGAVAVQLVAPPGANKYINIVKIACYTVYGTQTFTDTDGAFIAYGDFSTGLSVGGGTISSAITANASMVNETPVQLTSVDAIRIANVGLNIVDQSSPTGGDSSVVVNVLYIINTAP